MIRQCLGQGAFKQVFAVCNVHTGELLAMKRIHMSRPGSYTWEQIRREVDAMRRCRHVSTYDITQDALDMPVVVSNLQRQPHVLQCLRYQREGAFAALFTPLAHGTVEDLLQSQIFVQSPGLADQLFREMVTVLVRVHGQRVVHRDIKPSNILYTVEGDRYHFFLGDFGLAVNADRARTQVGTPLFLAPEVLGTSTGRDSFNPALDVWSLFVTMACVIDTARLRATPLGN